VPKDEVGVVRDLVKKAMTTVLDIGVPLEVSVGVGDTWLEAH
jgi:DNA polymerase I-like protein with 3'-5' exonuclease and polymerase domains